MSPAIRVGGARGSRPGALEVSSRVCGCPLPSWPRGRERSTPARREGTPTHTGTGDSGGAAALTVRAPLRLPVALPQVMFHVRGSPRCCAQVSHGARARPSPGCSPATASQSRRRRLRPGPSHRRRRGHACRRPAASGAAEPELSPGISPAAGGSLRRSTWWRGPLVWPPRGVRPRRGRSCGRGGRGLHQPGGGGAWAAGAKR